jgi:methanogen homocitrate synthase
MYKIIVKLYIQFNRVYLMTSKHIYIHDTTLRDGEQMPGVIFSYEEKLNLAEKFVEFGVNEIDIMPAVSASEARLAMELAEKYPDIISATCRMKKNEIDQVRELGIRKITLFAPLSDIFLNKKFGTNRKENLTKAYECVKYAKSIGLVVNFAGMDSTRTDQKYLLNFIKSIENSIDIFYLADTIGKLSPAGVSGFVSGIKNEAKCRIGIHVHNDFAMATANTIMAINAGADAFSGTFTGIGERAGNTPIEEVCVALKCLEEIELDVKYGLIREICVLVEKYSGVRLQPNKPVVGSNIFSHESGIHSDAILKSPKTFEPFEPELIGCRRNFWFGKHSGRNSLRHVLGKSNLNVSEEDLSGFLNHVKSLSESQKKSFSQDEVIQICREKVMA